MEPLPEIGTPNAANQDALIAQLQAENARLQREVKLLRQERENQKIKVHPLLEKRRAGILLHVTSLPATPGNGDLGDQAYYFVDFLKECGLSVWQMLPIHPTHTLPKGYPHRDFLSPYQCQCVHAGNPLLINLEWLVRKGWLDKLDDPPISTKIEDMIDYRQEWLARAYGKFGNPANSAFKTDRDAYAEFKEKNAFWLESYALFRVIKHKNGRLPWWKWREETLCKRDHGAIRDVRKQFDNQMQLYQFQQFVFFKQWQELKDYAHSKGVYLFGDMPMFVAEDSVEMWAERKYFWRDEHDRAKFVAGVKPTEDYFRKKGQCWGNPLYNWDVMQAEKFSWWMARLNTLGKLFDIVRLTHFRGFKKCWAIPGSPDTSRVPETGHWEDVPGELLFSTLRDAQQTGETFPLLVAEDVGAPSDETDKINALREQFAIPQIKILQIAFDIYNLGNAHFPHHHRLSDVVYTGTHDSKTTLDWFKGLAREEDDQTKPENRRKRKQQVCDYLNANPEDMPWPLIKAALASPAKLAIIPMQDLLGLEGEKNRMNCPGTSHPSTKSSNWRWRFEWSQVHEGIKERLKDWSNTYER